LLELVRGDANAGVADFDPPHLALAAARLGLGDQRDPAVLGELDGIANEIANNLLQPHRVAMDDRRCAALDGEIEDQALLRRGVLKHVDGMFEQGLEIEIAAVELHHARFNLGKVEDAVEHGHQ